MAGNGPPPKDRSRRARTNKDPVSLRVITAPPTSQPELPDTFTVIGAFGASFEYAIPEATRRWWKMWGESPLSTNYTANDWSELLDTALLHARFWMGGHSLAAELRLRVAKFGATPEDRARLRITFATADAVEDKPRKVSSSRYSDIRAIDATSA